jgi:MFS family permease
MVAMLVWRLLASLALSTIGGIGLWSVVVALPVIEAEFGVDRGGASLPYTATMIGFALGGVLMGRLADRFGIVAPIVLGACMLGAGYIAPPRQPRSGSSFWRRRC